MNSDTGTESKASPEQRCTRTVDEAARTYLHELRQWHGGMAQLHAETGNATSLKGRCYVDKRAVLLHGRQVRVFTV